MSTRELCKCWISIFLFFGQTVKEAQVRSIQNRFFKSIFARWNIKQNILFYWEHKVWLLWYLTLLFFHYEAWNKAMYFMPEFPRIPLPSFLFFFNLEHTQEVQSKLIKSGHLENFIFLKKNSFCTLIFLAGFPTWSSQSYAPRSCLWHHAPCEICGWTDICVVKRGFGLKSVRSFRMVSCDNSGQLPRDQEFSEQQKD